MIRSRVISGNSRDMRYNYIIVHEMSNLIWNKWRIETKREMMRIHRNGSRTGFLSVVVPSVSIKDRSLSAVLIGD